MIITIITNHREQIKRDRVTRISEVGVNRGTMVEGSPSIMMLQSRGRKCSCIERKRMGKGKGTRLEQGGGGELS